MQKFLEIFLSILTAVGGFVEIGELVFSVDAGAKFGYSLVWVVLLGTVGIMVYGEMSGRIAAVTGRPVFQLIRQKAGFKVGLVTLIAASLIGLMTCPIACTSYWVCLASCSSSGRCPSNGSKGFSG